MTNIRLTAGAAVLIALALVPTLLHNYFDLKSDDGYTAVAIGPKLAGLSSRPSDRREGWAKKFLDSDDWSERHYQQKDGGEIRLFVSRSYDLKRLYHHPELAVAYGEDLRDAGTARLPGMTDVVVHVLRGNGGQGTGLALYALLYGGSFVDNPYTFQLRTAGELLFGPRRPMTLFFADDTTAPATAKAGDSAVAQVLEAGIRSFQSQPTPAHRAQRQASPEPAGE